MDRVEQKKLKNFRKGMKSFWNGGRSKLIGLMRFWINGKGDRV
jgi:hypothetical protein